MRAFTHNGPLARLCLALALCGLLSLPARGFDVLAAGDGSDTNNPDLVGEGYENFDIEPGRLGEPPTPYYDTDLSVSLRGGYASDRNGGRFETGIVPSLTLRHVGVRSGYDFTASSEITRSSIEAWRVASLRLAFGADYALDSLTDAALDANFTLTTPSTLQPGLATDVLYGATTYSGSVNGSVTRDLGRLSFALRGNLGRNIYGPSTLNDLTVIENYRQNYNTAGAGLRLGADITPLLGIFGDASIARDFFDNPPEPPLVSANANTYALRGGLSYQRGTTFSAQASIGYGLRRFDDPTQVEVASTLYDASLTYRGVTGLVLNAGLSTTIAPPGPQSSGSARIEYAANASATYTVNSWLVLRALANWRTAQLTGSTGTDTGYSLGVGADYLINRHASLSADYTFSHNEVSPDPPDNGHRVTLGLTISR